MSKPLQTEALKLAFELAHEGVEIHSPNSPEYKVCAALIALAQLEQKPVGKLVSDDIEGHVFVPYGSEWPFNVDLYTEPPHHALMAQFYKDEYDQLKEKYKNLYNFRTSPSDGEIRKLWAEYASKIHAWPNNSTPPLCDINGYVGFQEPWHESEYQVFKAGYLSAFN